MTRALYWAALLGFGAAAAAQDAGVPSPNVDEIVVPGSSPRAVRLEIERVENAVYARFNALNSSDELDIDCAERTPTGSNIPVRTCAPRFMTTAQARAGADTVLDVQGSATSANPAEHAMRLQEKNRLLVDEMQRLAREDDELLRGLTRLAELKQVQEAEQQQARRNGRQRRAER